LLPLFKDPSQSVRDYVYGEQGPARSIKTKDWNYISLRYTTEQIAALNSERRERYAKTLLGLSGGISRAAVEHSGAFDADQLYHLKIDPAEKNNLANNPEQEPQLKTMQTMMTEALKQFPDRPYGEFVPGGNTKPLTESEAVLEILRQIDKEEKASGGTKGGSTKPSGERKEARQKRKEAAAEQEKHPPEQGTPARP
jgi:hypothetical protein